MTHHTKPHTNIKPRPLSAYEQNLMFQWHQRNVQVLKDLDQEIRWSVQNGGSTVFAQFIQTDVTKLSTAQAVK